MNSPRLAISIFLLVLATNVAWGGGSNPRHATLGNISEGEDQRIQMILNEYVTDIEGNDWEKKFHALASCLDKLDWHAGLNRSHLDKSPKVFPNDETRRKFTLVLLYINQQLSSVSLSEKRYREFKRAVYGGLVAYGDRINAMPFIREQLPLVPKMQRITILVNLGHPACIYSDEFYEDVEGLYRKGILERDERIGYLHHLDPKRAQPEVVRIGKRTTDRREFIAAARILQRNEKPELLRLIYSRALELELDKRDKSVGGTMSNLFWIDDRIFGRFLESAQGKDLSLAMELLGKGTGRVGMGGIPVVLKRDLIRHPDPIIRRVAILQIRRAISWDLLSTDAALELLDEAEKNEKVESVRTVITGEKGYLRARKERGARNR